MITNPIEEVTTHVMKTSTHLSTPDRIRLYESLAEIIARPEQRGEVLRVVNALRTADKQCREFSFVHDQI